MSDSLYLTKEAMGEKKVCPACHPEQSEGSLTMGSEILRFAQDDTGQPIRLSSSECMVHPHYAV